MTDLIIRSQKNILLHPDSRAIDLLQKQLDHDSRARIIVNSTGLTVGIISPANLPNKPRFVFCTPWSRNTFVY